MTADTVGGVFSCAIELASTLARSGAQIALATLGGPLAPGQQRAALAIPGLSLFASDYRLEWMDDPCDDMARSGEWLVDLERRLRLDLVHLSSYAHAGRRARARAIARSPTEMARAHLDLYAESLADPTRVGAPRWSETCA